MSVVKDHEELNRKAGQIFCLTKSSIMSLSLINSSRVNGSTKE